MKPRGTKDVANGVAIGVLIVATMVGAQTTPPKTLHVEWGPATALTFTGPIPSERLPDTGDLVEQKQDIGPTWAARARHGELGSPQASHASKTGPRSRLFRTRFFPGGAFGYVLDPTLAVGSKYIVLSEASDLAFFDKQQPSNANATPLPSLPGGVKTSLSYDEFFSRLVAPTNLDGSVNQNNINRYLELGPNPSLACDSTKVPVYPVAKPFAPFDACVNEFYDARALYDAVHKRFILLAQARNTIGIWTEQKLDSPFDSTQTWRQYFTSKGYTNAEIENLVKFSALARRYLAFAVSRTEDPRDGFHQYIFTESNYADWPLGTVGQRLLVLGHKSAPEAGKPALYGIALDAIEQGKSNPPVATLTASAFGGAGYPVPVVSYDYDANAIWLVDDTGSSLQIYAVGDFADPAIA